MSSPIVSSFVLLLTSLLLGVLSFITPQAGNQSALLFNQSQSECRGEYSKTIGGIEFSVTNFGATGNDRDLDSMAFTQAMNCAEYWLNNNADVSIYIPYGTYYLSNSLILGNTVNEFDNFTLKGDGQFLTTLVIQGENTDGININSTFDSVTVQDLRFIAENKLAGSAINIQSSSGNKESYVLIDNVFIMGQEQVKDRPFFATGIRLNNITNAYIYDSEIRATFGARNELENGAPTKCVHVINGHNLKIEQGKCLAVTNAIDYTGSGNINVIRNHSFGVNSDIAYLFNMNSGTVNISDTHTNAWQRNIDIKGADKFIYSNSYTLTKDETDNPDHAVVYARDVNEVILRNMNYSQPRNSNANKLRASIITDRNVGKVELTNNIFDEYGDAIRTSRYTSLIEENNLFSDRVQKQYDIY